MRLLFLNRVFWPDREATGELLAELCADLSREHDVTVIAGPPSDGPGRGLVCQEMMGRVCVVRTWGTRLPKRLLPARLLNLGTYYALAAVAAARQPRPDVVITETDPPLLGVLGAMLKARWQCRFIYYCQDVYPDVAVVTGGVRNALLLRSLARGNRRAYAAADVVVAVGRDMRKRLLAQGVAPDKVVVVPNWTDCSAIRPHGGNRFREQFGDKFVVMYSGNLGLSQSLETVLEAAGRLRDDERVLFVLVGDGARRRALEERARRAGLQNVRFLPYQPKEGLADSLGAADVHVIPLRAGLEGCVVPSKVYGIMAAGRPFVAMMRETAEVAMLAREFGVGFVIPPEDAGALARVVREAMERPSLLADMGARGRRLAETRFDRAIVTGQFAGLLDSQGLDSVDARRITR